MNTTSATLASVILMTSFFSVPSSAQEEEIVFQERFVNETGSRTWMADYGWTALLYDPEFADKNNLVDVSADENVVLDVHAHLMGVAVSIGHETCFCDEDLGWVEYWNTPRFTWTVMTTPFALDRSQMEITRVTWADQSGYASAPFDHEVRLVIQIDGQLYATAVTYDPHEDGHGNTWALVEHAFTTEGSDWLYLSAEAGSPLNLGDPVEGRLPDGNVEAVGLYMVHPDSSPHESVRVDDITVYATAVENEDPQWAGYAIAEQNGRHYVDTSGWMGWLDVTDSPWNFSLSLDSWLYMEESSASDENGAWIYLIK